MSPCGWAVGAGPPPGVRFIRRTYRTQHTPAMIYYSGRKQQNQQREKEPGRVVQRKQDANFQEPFPGVPQGELMPPALGSENTCEMLSPRRVPQRLGAQGWYQGLVMQASSTWHVPKFQTPRRKAGVQPKARCLHDRSGNVSCSYQLESSPNPSSQRPAKGQTCKQAFQRTAVSGLLCECLSAPPTSFQRIPRHCKL